MKLEYPYQLVAFIDNEPAIGEPVYYGENGWFPQIALKRRFKTIGITEDELLQKLTSYFSNMRNLTIRTNGLIQPEQMPVQVLEVEKSPELMELHSDVITFLGDTIKSRYPERDGQNYLPHITAEYAGQMVIDHEKYSNRTFLINKIYLLKDVTDENSIAYASFTLR